MTPRTMISVVLCVILLLEHQSLPADAHYHYITSPLSYLNIFSYSYWRGSNSTKPGLVSSIVLRQNLRKQQEIQNAEPRSFGYNLFSSLYRILSRRYPTPVQNSTEEELPAQITTLPPIILPAESFARNMEDSMFELTTEAPTEPTTMESFQREPKELVESSSAKAIIDSLENFSNSVTMIPMIENRIIETTTTIPVQRNEKKLDIMKEDEEAIELGTASITTTASSVPETITTIRPKVQDSIPIEKDEEFSTLPVQKSDPMTFIIFDDKKIDDKVKTNVSTTNSVIDLNSNSSESPDSGSFDSLGSSETSSEIFESSSESEESFEKVTTTTTETPTTKSVTETETTENPEQIEITTTKPMVYSPEPELKPEVSTAAPTTTEVSVESVVTSVSVEISDAQDNEESNKKNKKMLPIALVLSEQDTKFIHKFHDFYSNPAIFSENQVSSNVPDSPPTPHNHKPLIRFEENDHVPTNELNYWFTANQKRRRRTFPSS